jgi:hypothetical protein
MRFNQKVLRLNLWHMSKWHTEMEGSFLSKKASPSIYTLLWLLSVLEAPLKLSLLNCKQMSHCIWFNCLHITESYDFQDIFKSTKQITIVGSHIWCQTTLSLLVEYCLPKMFHTFCGQTAGSMFIVKVSLTWVSTLCYFIMQCIMEIFQDVYTGMLVKWLNLWRILMVHSTLVIKDGFCNMSQQIFHSGCM